MTTKTCNTCEETKSLDEFHADPAKKDGRRNQCKVCRLSKARVKEPKKYRASSHVIVDGKKLCTGCKNMYPLHVFDRQATTKTGYSYYCKACKSAKRKPSYGMKERLKKYGITQEKFNQMMNEQGGLCAICKKDISETAYIDHCHTSLEVRGLLCHHCNSGLGMFFDNPEYLRAAIDYLSD